MTAAADAGPALDLREERRDRRRWQQPAEEVRALVVGKLRRVHDHGTAPTQLDAVGQRGLRERAPAQRLARRAGGEERREQRQQRRLAAVPVPGGGEGERAVGAPQRAQATVGERHRRVRQRALPGVDRGRRPRPRVRERERDRPLRRRADGEARLRDDRGARAAAAQSPEQVGAPALRAAHDAAVGEHHRRAAQAVGRHAVAAHQAPEAATERQAGDPDGRAGADRQRAAVPQHELAVDVEHIGSAADPRDRAVVLERDGVDPRDVGDDPAHRVGVARERVAPAARGDGPAARAGEANDVGDVSGALAERDRARFDVQTRVVQRACRRPALVARRDERAAQAPAQLGGRRCGGRGGRQQRGRARNERRRAAAAHELASRVSFAHAGRTVRRPEGCGACR